MKSLKEKEQGSIQKNTKKNLQLKELPEWFPKHLEVEFFEKDLTYSSCLHEYSRIEMAKRQDIPKETMRIWFIEFVKYGWTQELIRKKADVLMKKEIFGKLEIAHWINADTTVIKQPEPFQTPPQTSPEDKKTLCAELRKTIEEIDKKIGSRNTKFGNPFGWKYEFYNNWKLGNRIKKVLREEQKKSLFKNKPKGI